MNKPFGLKKKEYKKQYRILFGAILFFMALDIILRLDYNL